MHRCYALSKARQAFPNRGSGLQFPRPRYRLGATRRRRADRLAPQLLELWYLPQALSRPQRWYGAVRVLFGLARYLRQSATGAFLTCRVWGLYQTLPLFGGQHRDLSTHWDCFRQWVDLRSHFQLQPLRHPARIQCSVSHPPQVGVLQIRFRALSALASAAETVRTRSNWKQQHHQMARSERRIRFVKRPGLLARQSLRVRHRAVAGCPNRWSRRQPAVYRRDRYPHRPACLARQVACLSCLAPLVAPQPDQHPLHWDRQAGLWRRWALRAPLVAHAPRHPVPDPLVPKATKRRPQRLQPPILLQDHRKIRAFYLCLYFLPRALPITHAIV